MRVVVILLWVLILVAVLLPLLRRALAARSRPAALPDELVKDPVCQTYVLRSRAVRGRAHGETGIFLQPGVRATVRASGGMTTLHPDPYRHVDAQPDPAQMGAALEERGRAASHRRLLRRFLAFVGVGSGATVLEVGCGTGVVLRQLAARVGPRGRVVGVDPSRAFLAAAARILRDRPERPQITLKTGDGAHLPFADGKFDATLAVTVLLHVADPLAVVKEMARVTRPGGVVGLQDQDFGTVALTHPERALTERILGGVVSHIYEEPWSGRRLPGLLPVGRSRAPAAPDHRVSGHDARAVVEIIPGAPCRERRTLRSRGRADRAALARRADRDGGGGGLRTHHQLLRRRRREVWTGTASMSRRRPSQELSPTVRPASSLAVAFTAGWVIMMLEILGGRVLAPYFGYSVYQWGALIGVVMAALALGYWLGGRVGDGPQAVPFLLAALVVSTVFVLLVPWFAPAFLPGMRAWGPAWGAVGASALLLGLPSVLLAAVSPDRRFA